jgi:hypothetical protein
MRENIMTIPVGSIVERDGSYAEVARKTPLEGPFITATFRTCDGDFEERFYLPSDQGWFNVVSRPVMVCAFHRDCDGNIREPHRFTFKVEK